MRHETQIDQVIRNESNRIREVYEDIIRSYLDGILPEYESWHVINCIYFDYSVLDRKITNDGEIFTDQYLVYGIHRGVYHHKFITRDEFESKLRESGVPSE